MNPEKPGWKTTEFVLTAIAAAVGLLATAGVFTDNHSTLGQAFGFIQTSLVTLGYSIARGLTKSGVAKAAGEAETARATVTAARLASRELPAVSGGGEGARGP